MGGGKTTTSKATLFYIYALGICAMCGRQNFKWQIGYGLHGFYHYGLTVIIYAIAFIMLTYCFAELVSIVPFSGGCYGYSRCSMGPMVGYLAGMIETAKYILYATFSLYRLGHIFFTAFGLDERFQIVIWLIFLVSFNLIHAFQLRMLWWIVGLVGVAIICVQATFIFGATVHGSTTNLDASRWDSNPKEFCQTFPYAIYMLSALDAMRTCVDEQGSKVVPKAMIHILMWSTVAALASLVAQSAYNFDDGALIKEDYAYNVGLRRVFSLRKDDKLVTLFALPGAFGCCLAFLYCASRQVRSMASSGLLPKFLAIGHGASQKVKDSTQLINEAVAVLPSETVEESGKSVSSKVGDMTSGHKPTVAVFACSILVFALLLSGYYTVTNYGDVYSQMGALLNSLMYQFLMAAYVVFYTRFSGMERGLTSPFGVPGAVFAAAFFLFLFTVRLYYNPKMNTGFGVTLVVFFVLVMVYYYAVVQKRQFFSKEEQEKFMKAYVVNANKTRKRGGLANGSNKKSSNLMAIFRSVSGFIQASPSRAVSNRSHASSRSGMDASRSFFNK